MQMTKLGVTCVYLPDDGVTLQSLEEGLTEYAIKKAQQQSFRRYFTITHDASNTSINTIEPSLRSVDGDADL